MSLFSFFVERCRGRTGVSFATGVALIWILFVPADVESYDPPVTRIDSGLLEGVRISIGNKEVDGYLGIPYAEPPVGELRFQRPRPISSWQGVYKATSKPKPCKQLQCPLVPKVILDYTNASEDCLFINVWKPASMCSQPRNSSCNQQLPVYVFIHGGGFQWGDSSLLIYDAANFVALTGVVVVTFNYRVGINGFLSLDMPEIPGNMGLWDQNLVLKWVQRNIASFGGDPNEVTIGGQSAGATSVALHAVSPHSKGLFKRAIMQSGAPLSMIATIYFRGEGKFINTAAALGCYEPKKALREQLGDVISCLRRLDASFIIKSVGKFDFVQRMYAPVDKDEFIPFSVLTPETWRKINVKDVLLGTTVNEATLFVNVIQEAFPQLIGMMKTQYRMLSIIVMAQTLSLPVSHSREIVRSYFGEDSQEHSFERVKEILATMLGDAVFDCPAQLFADSASRQGIKTYRYLFGYRPTHSLYEDWMGVAHGEDVFYTLGSLPFMKDTSRYTEPMRKAAEEVLTSKDYTAEEEQFMKEIVATWASFIKTGKPATPNPEARWKEYTAGNRHPVFLLKPHNYTTLNDGKRKRCTLWTSILYRTENKSTGADPTVPSSKPTKQTGRKVAPKPEVAISTKDRKMSSGTAKLPLACLLYAAMATTIFLR